MKEATRRDQKDYVAKAFVRRVRKPADDARDDARDDAIFTKARELCDLIADSTEPSGLQDEAFGLILDAVRIATFNAGD